MIRKLFFLLVVTIYQIESMEKKAIDIKIEDIKNENYREEEIPASKIIHNIITEEAKDIKIKNDLMRFLQTEGKKYTFSQKPFGKKLITERLFGKTKEINDQNEAKVKKMIKDNLPYTEEDMTRQKHTKNVPNSVLACIRNYFLNVYVELPYDYYVKAKKIFFKNLNGKALQGFALNDKNIFYTILTQDNYKFFYNQLNAGIFRFINKFNSKKIEKIKKKKIPFLQEKQKLDETTKKKIQKEILEVELQVKSTNISISDKLRILQENLKNFEKMYQNGVRKESFLAAELKSKIRLGILKKIKEFIDKPKKDFSVNKNIYTIAQNSVFEASINNENKNNHFSFTASDKFLQLLRSIFEKDIKELKNNIKKTMQINSLVELENLKNEARDNIIEGSQNNNITEMIYGIHYLYVIFKETFKNESHKKKKLYQDYHNLMNDLKKKDDINFFKEALKSRINDNSENSIFYLSLKPIVESIKPLENNIDDHDQSHVYSDDVYSDDVYSDSDVDNKQINKKRRQKSFDGNSSDEDDSKYGDLITKKPCTKNNNEEVKVKIEENK